MSVTASSPAGKAVRGGFEALSSDPLWRCALLASLAEGLAIAVYDVLMRDLDRLFGALFWSVALVAVGLVVWLAVGSILRRLLPERWSFLATFVVWIAAIAVGRVQLADRLGPTTWWLLACGTVFAVAGTILSDRGAAVSLAALLRDVGVLAAAAGSLAGRVPNQAYPALEQTLFLAGVALVAYALVELGSRRPRLLFVSLLSVAAVCAVLARGSSRTEGPSVLWILVDTARQDHVAPYGEIVETPAIRKLASEGVLFRDAITVVPKTPASVASFFTGRYPTRHRVRSLYDRLPDEESTAAELFREAGFDTAAFVNNGWIARGRGFEQGFERFTGYFEAHRPYGPLRYTSWWLLGDQLSAKKVPRFSAQTSSARLTDDVLQYLEAHRGRRSFVYAHYFEPHWPYLPPPALARRYGAPEDGRVVVNHIGQTEITRGQMIFQNPLPEAENEVARRLYRGEMHHTMFHIGRLLGGLSALGLDDDTIVAFTADHGHALGEHDYYFHHGEFLYEDSVRIPLILRWSGQLPEGVEVEAQVRSIDLAPTLLDLASAPRLTASDGSALAAFWEEADTLPRPAYLESDVKMFAENNRREFGGIPGKLRGLRDGRFKLIMTPASGGVRYELYDLTSDPTESIDLSTDSDHQAILQALQTQLARVIPSSERAAIESLGGTLAGPERELSDDELEMLRSLGYVQ